jgi:hypothetical protein
MITFSTILQGHEATEENAVNFALGFDFSEDETEENPVKFNDYKYIDTLNGIDIYYCFGADYYFFGPEEEEDNYFLSDQAQFWPKEY